MIIEYYATDEQDRRIERALDAYDIVNWFNPEDGYYVLETNDDRVITTLSILGIEVYYSNKTPDSLD
jgi:hypothetical protein